MDVFVENRYDGLQIEDSQFSSYDAIEHMRRTFMHLQYLSICQHIVLCVPKQHVDVHIEEFPHIVVINQA